MAFAVTAAAAAAATAEVVAVVDASAVLVVVDVVVVVVVVIVVVVGGGFIVPHGRGRRGVADHGVAGVRAVVDGQVPQGELSVFVEFLELGAAVLEPDLHLKRRNSQINISDWIFYFELI